MARTIEVNSVVDERIAPIEDDLEAMLFGILARAIERIAREFDVSADQRDPQ